MHSILFTVMHSHMQLLSMTVLEGKMMIDCMQGVSRRGTEGKLGFKYSTG